MKYHIFLLVAALAMTFLFAVIGVRTHGWTRRGAFAIAALMGAAVATQLPYGTGPAVALGIAYIVLMYAAIWHWFTGAESQPLQAEPGWKYSFLDDRPERGVPYLIYERPD